MTSHLKIPFQARSGHATVLDRMPFPLNIGNEENPTTRRRSLEECQGSLETHLDQLPTRCEAYKKTAYLLSEDIERTLENQRNVGRHCFKISMPH